MPRYFPRFSSEKEQFFITEPERPRASATVRMRNSTLKYFGFLFELGPVEVEVTVGLDSKGTAGAKVRFWVVELSGEGEVAQSSLQRIKLTLQPRMAGTMARPEVSDTERPGER